MVLRTAVGTVAGSLAGAGLLVTIYMFASYCDSGRGRRGCGAGSVLLIPSFFLFWMYVAGVLIVLGFGMRRQGGGWPTAWIGSGLWVVLGMAFHYVDALYVHPQMPTDLRVMAHAAVIVPCVAYTIAALCTYRLREPQ